MRGFQRDFLVGSQRPCSERVFRAREKATLQKGRAQAERESQSLLPAPQAKTKSQKGVAACGNRPRVPRRSSPLLADPLAPENSARKKPDRLPPTKSSRSQPSSCSPPMRAERI